MHGRSHERVLIVEDDPILAEIIKATLEYGGYETEIARTAASAFDRLRNSSLDVITVDLGLPDGDGLEVVSAFHRTTDIPLIVISGRREEADKIAALDAGADDYIEKPFLPGELLARIRAKLRLHRTNGLDEPDSPFRVGREAEASLSRLERGLLALLIKHRGATVSEDAIIASLWEADGRGTSADVRSLVLKLRRKLQVQRQPLFVLNEHGVGYYVSAFGRFPRRARSRTQAAQGTSPSAPQDVHRSARGVTAQPSRPSPSETESPFFRKSADIGSKERVRR